MGNCFVCKSSSSTSETAKLIDTRDGTLKQVKIPVKAAELMLEYPGHVVSSSDQIQSSKTILPLRADDEIEAGKIYMLFAICRVNRKVTEAEMMVLEVVSGRKRSGGSAQVAPAAETAVERDSEEEEEAMIVGRGRRWRPVLEPISEVF